MTDIHAGLRTAETDQAGRSHRTQAEAAAYVPRLISITASAAMVGVLFFASVVSPAARTIVGTWAPDPAACTPVGGMISIGPMFLTGDETQCAFRDVARDRDVVTWHGTCSDGATHVQATVTATLHFGALTVIRNGIPDGVYRRCTPAR